MILSRHCAEIQAVAKRGDTAEARRMVAQLESEHASVQAALTAEFEALSASRELRSNLRMQ